MNELGGGEEMNDAPSYKTLSGNRKQTVFSEN